MEEYDVAFILLGFVNRGRIAVYRIAHPVRGCGFDERPESTAHGGAIVNDKESGPAQAGHGFLHSNRPLSGFLGLPYKMRRYAQKEHEQISRWGNQIYPHPYAKNLLNRTPIDQSETRRAFGL